LLSVAGAKRPDVLLKAQSGHEKGSHEGEPSLWISNCVLAIAALQRDFFFAGSGREPNRASSNSTSSLEAIWIIRRISISLCFVRQREVSAGSCDLVSGLFQACFKDQPGWRLFP
jgi:hypothetical protein